MRGIYQEVAERILAVLDQGTVPWIKPSSAGDQQPCPINAVAKQPYSGINLPLGREACVYCALRFRQRRALKGPPVSSVFRLVYQGPAGEKGPTAEGNGAQG